MVGAPVEGAHAHLLENSQCVLSSVSKPVPPAPPCELGIPAWRNLLGHAVPSFARDLGDFMSAAGKQEILCWFNCRPPRGPTRFFATALPSIVTPIARSLGEPAQVGIPCCMLAWRARA